MQKTYLIAGGSSGIGYELSLHLRQQGHKVIVFSRQRRRLSEDITHYSMDFESEQIDWPVIDDRIDGLAYLPGSILLKPFKTLKSEDFMADYKLNVIGAQALIRQYLGKMNPAGASIVLMSTVAVRTGMPYHTMVAASKGAVEGLTRALAAELSPNIRVNAIAPSLTDTPLAEKLLNTEDKRKASMERHPLKTVGEAANVAAMIEFLLSDKSTFMTAQIIAMDGGLSGIRKI